MVFNIKDYETKDSTYTHQSLAGGKYNIPKEKVKSLYKMLIKSNKFSLCEKLTPVFMMYYDIDGLSEDLDINNLVNLLKDSIPEYFDVKGENKNVFDETFVLQNQVKTNNYHIYFPKVFVNKLIIRSFCKYLNYKTGNDVFDENAYNSCFRMYGVLKYNRKTNSYDANSNYDFMIQPEMTEMEKFTKLCIQTDFEEPNVDLKDFVKDELKEKFRKKNIEGYVSSKMENSEREIQGTSFDIFEREKIDYYLKNVSHNNYQFAKYMLYQVFNEERYQDNKKWSDLLYVMADLNVPKNLIFEWSKQSTHYTPSNNWLESAIEIPYNKQVITYDDIASSYNTVLKWGKEDNIKKFKQYKFGVSEYENVYLDMSVIMRYIFNGQDGLCRLFSNMYQERIKMTGNAKDYCLFYWDGDLWVEDKKSYINRVFTSQIRKIIRFVKNYLQNKMEAEPDNKKIFEAQIKEIVSLEKSIGKTNFIKECIRSFFSYFYSFSFEQKLNSNQDILAVKNGNVNLKTGKLYTRTIYDYNSFKIDVSYDQEQDTAQIQQFMDDIMIGQTDIIHFIQKFLGYGITGSIEEQKFGIFYGKNGSNGKSVLCKLLTRVFGEYVTTLEANIFSINKAQAGAATTHLNYIENKRMGFLDESEKGQKFDEGAIKRITGGTKMNIRKLYREGSTMDINLTPVLLTNFKPNFSDDPALHRRIFMVEFEATFMEDTDERWDPTNPKYKLIDQKIEEKISNEEVLRYFVQGAMNWYREGLKNIPRKLLNLSKQFKNSCNKVKEFIRKFKIEGNSEDEFTSLRKMYDQYSTYIYPEKINMNDFKDNIEDIGLCEMVKDNISGYKINLKEE
jgi:P4 family phage/plasmid primase-like protien